MACIRQWCIISEAQQSNFLYIHRPSLSYRDTQRSRRIHLARVQRCRNVKSWNVETAERNDCNLAQDQTLRTHTYVHTCSREEVNTCCESPVSSRITSNRNVGKLASTPWRQLQTEYQTIPSPASDKYTNVRQKDKRLQRWKKKDGAADVAEVKYDFSEEAKFLQSSLQPPAFRKPQPLWTNYRLRYPRPAITSCHDKSSPMGIKWRKSTHDTRATLRFNAATRFVCGKSMWEASRSASEFNVGAYYWLEWGWWGKLEVGGFRKRRMLSTRSTFSE